MEAAVAYEQLKKLDDINRHRIEIVDYLNERLVKHQAIVTPKVRENCTHVYYMHVLRFQEQIAGVSRARFIEAIRAEGIAIWGGYIKPLYLEPIYQQKIAYKGGYPFKNNAAYDKEINYDKGLCPVAEMLYEKETIINIYNYKAISMDDAKDIADGFDKVFENINELL